MLRLGEEQRKLLQAFMRRQGLEQTHLADRCQMSNDTISKVLAGASVRLRTVERVRDILSIPAHLFYKPDLMQL